MVVLNLEISFSPSDVDTISLGGSMDAPSEVMLGTGRGGRSGVVSLCNS